METTGTYSLRDDDLRRRMRVHTVSKEYIRRPIFTDVRRPARTRCIPVRQPHKITRGISNLSSAKVVAPNLVNPLGSRLSDMIIDTNIAHHRQHRLPKNWQTAVIWGMALVVFGVGTSVTLLQLKTNRTVKGQVSALAQRPASVFGSGDETPSDSDTVNNYRVAPELPRVLSISKLNIRARVKSVTTDNKGQIGAPASIFDTGWYDMSAKPGETGAMFIDGHVHGPTKPGVFAELKKLVKGDKLEIERGDGKTFRYSVVKSQIYKADQVDLAAALSPATPGKQALNLMTCAGKFNGSDYQDRLVVFAVAE